MVPQMIHVRHGPCTVHSPSLCLEFFFFWAVAYGIQALGLGSNLLHWKLSLNN